VAAVQVAAGKKRAAAAEAVSEMATKMAANGWAAAPVLLAPAAREDET